MVINSVQLCTDSQLIFVSDAEIQKAVNHNWSRGWCGERFTKHVEQVLSCNATVHTCISLSHTHSNQLLPPLSYSLDFQLKHKVKVLLLSPTGTESFKEHRSDAHQPININYTNCLLNLFKFLSKANYSTCYMFLILSQIHLTTKFKKH